MDAAAARRYARHVALPEVGAQGQERIGAAAVAIAGDDLVAESAARYLTAAGVREVRLIGRRPPPEHLVEALRGSGLRVEVAYRPWPGDGGGWVRALEGAALVVRSGFDDDAMLRAAVRLGIPAVVARARKEGADVVAFHRQGPCPHAPLDVPVKPAEGGGEDGPGAVVAGTLAAAEALQVLLGSAGEVRARHLSLPLDGGEPRAGEIPWRPECFLCGGSGTEAVFP